MGTQLTKSELMRRLREKWNKIVSEEMRRKIKGSSKRKTLAKGGAQKMIASELAGKTRKARMSIEEKKWGFRRKEAIRTEKGLADDGERERAKAEAIKSEAEKRREINLNRSIYFRDVGYERDANLTVAQKLTSGRTAKTTDRKSARTKEAADRVQTIGRGKEKTKITASEIGVSAQEGVVAILGNEESGTLGGTQAHKAGGTVASRPDARSVAGSFNKETKLTGNFPGAEGMGGGGIRPAPGKALPGGGISGNIGSRPSIPLSKK